MNGVRTVTIILMSVSVMNRRAFLKIAGIGAGASLLKPPADIIWPPGVVTRFDLDKRGVPFYCLTIDDGWHGDYIESQFRYCLNKGVFPFTWFANGVGIENIRQTCVGDEPNCSSYADWFFWARLTVGYHTLHHPAVEDQRRNYNRARWIEDYEEWLERATETFGETQETIDTGGSNHQIIQPLARAAGGYFSDPFMEMCDEKGLTPVGWSVDPYTLNRGAVIKPGDIFLTHWRYSEWKWFDMLAEADASGELIAQEFTAMEQIERDHLKSICPWWRRH